MKDSKAKLQGLLTDNLDIKKIVFNTIKMNILSILNSVSKILQESNLLLPELITIVSTAMKTVKKMKKLVETNEDPFGNAELFPTLNKFLEQLKEEPEELLPYCQTRNAAQANPGGFKFTFHGYLLTGEPDKAKQVCKNLYTEVLTALEEAMTERLDCITKDSLFKPSAAFLDTHCYQFTDFDNIFTHIVKIKDKFEVQLLGNGCDIAKLKSKAEILFNHMKNFGSNKPSSKTWPVIFP